MKTLKGLSLAFIACALLFFGGCSGASEGEGFAIYFTRDDVRPDKMTAFREVALAGEPVISMADIVSYDAKTHEIELTSEAYGRVSALKVPTFGKSFVVCVDRKPVYWGAFWAGYSSQSFDGVTIIGWPFFSEKDDTIAITVGYPAPGFYNGQDPRGNPVIMDALRAAGKLKE